MKKANQLKGTGYYINEDFSKETLEIRKENWKKVKQLRENGKYAVLVNKLFGEKEIPQTLPTEFVGNANSLFI